MKFFVDNVHGPEMMSAAASAVDCAVVPALWPERTAADAHAQTA